MRPEDFPPVDIILIGRYAGRVTDTVNEALAVVDALFQFQNYAVRELYVVTGMKKPRP